MSAPLTRAQAAEIIVRWAGGGAEFTVPAVLTSQSTRQAAYLRAAARVHPDQPGGSAAELARLNAARGFLLSTDES